MTEEEKIITMSKIAFYMMKINQQIDGMRSSQDFPNFMESVLNGTHLGIVEGYKSSQIELLEKIIDLKKLINEPYFDEALRIKTIREYKATTMEDVISKAKEKIESRSVEEDNPVGFYDPQTFSHN